MISVSHFFYIGGRKMKVLSGQTAQTVTESGDDRSLQEKSSKFHSRAGVWKAPKRQGCRVARAGSPDSASRRGTIRIDFEDTSVERGERNANLHIISNCEQSKNARHQPSGSQPQVKSLLRHPAHAHGLGAGRGGGASAWGGPGWSCAGWHRGPRQHPPPRQHPLPPPRQHPSPR